MSELNNCDMKDWTRELQLPNYSLGNVNGGLPMSEMLVYGGTLGAGKSCAMELAKEALLARGYTTTSITPSSTTQVFYFDELSKCYEIKTTNPLTYYDNTPRIEPSELLMKPSNLITNLIGRI